MATVEMKKNNFFTWLEYLLGQTRSTSPVNQKMNRQESEFLKKFVASAPASPWKYWPFAFPCLFAIVGFLIHLGILIWFKTKADISLLVQNGENITTFWDSRLTQSFVLTTSLLIVFNFALLAVLAALTLRQRQVIDRLISEREDKGH